MTDRELLDELLDRYEDLPKSERENAVAEFCRKYPHLASQLCREIALLEKVNRQIEEDSDVSFQQQSEIPTEIIAGRYRAIKPFDQGGLGQIFVAQDLELGREVALKRILPGRSAFADNEARFRREAKITGRLEHPGIVPTYGLCNDAQGRPYYAMRLMKGGTLDKAIETFHRNHPVGSDPGAIHAGLQSLMRRFLTVCQTIAYAHSKGILHRDLKPLNVLAGDYGETVVIDWGLAKSIGEAEEESSTPPASAAETGVLPTTVGQRKGSPAYMSPEQAEGHTHNLTKAADIYALGASLYKLLTGQPPFEGGPDIFDRVARGQFISPRRVRRDVPAALEAICLKAMRRRPEDRYASASEMAADVERWLADEPVHAWREPLAMQARRWVKRHRTLVAALALATIVATIVSTAAGFILAGKNTQLQRTNNELIIANNSIRREFDDANHALRGLVENMMVSGRLGAGNPMLRHDTLKIYLMYLTGFVVRNYERPELRFEVAAACLHCGEINLLLGRSNEALTSYEQAFEFFERLAQDNPTNREAQYGMACAIGERGKILTEQGRFAEAKPLLLDARQRFADIARDATPLQLARMSSAYAAHDFRDSPALRLAQVTLALISDYPVVEAISRPSLIHGSFSIKLGDEQRRWVEEALQTLTGGRDKPLSTPVFEQFTALSLELAIITQGKDRPAQQRRLEAIVQRVDNLLKTYPLFYELRVLTIHARMKLAEVAVELKQPPVARQHLMQARDAAIRLEADLQKNDPFHLLGTALITQVEVQEKLVSLVPGPGADEQWQIFVSRTAFENAMKALDRYMTLKRHTPTDTATAIVYCTRMALWALQAGGRKHWADEAYDMARRLCELQLRETPGDEAMEYFLLAATTASASMKATDGKTIDDLVTRAEDLLRKLSPGDPDDSFLTLQQTALLNAQSLEATLVKRDRPRGIQCLEQSLAILAEAQQKFPEVEEIPAMRYGHQIQLAASLASLGEDLLNETPPQPNRARPLLAHAKSILQSLQPPPPATIPEIQFMIDRFRRNHTRALTLIEQLEKKTMN